jgi:hypothetical protein
MKWHHKDAYLGWCQNCWNHSMMVEKLTTILTRVVRRKSSKLSGGHKYFILVPPLSFCPCVQVILVFRVP